MNRRCCLAILTATVLGEPVWAQSQGNVKPRRFAAIGAGRYEFPIAGNFRLFTEGQATVFEASDASRRYYVGSFNNVSASREASPEERLSRLEPVVRGSWERFATSENGVVRVAFNRVAAPQVNVFYMATEFNERNGLQYYVQYAATDGRSIGTIFAEGLGPALPVHEELLPIILRVKVAGGI